MDSAERPKETGARGGPSQRKADLSHLPRHCNSSRAYDSGGDPHDFSRQLQRSDLQRHNEPHRQPNRHLGGCKGMRKERGSWGTPLGGVG